MTRNNLFVLLVLVFFATSVGPLRDFIREGEMMKTPAGTTALLFERIADARYEKAAALYLGGGSVRQVSEVGAAKPRLKDVRTVGMDGDMAVVEFDLFYGGSDRTGYFVLREREGSWYIVSAPTADEERRMKTILK